MMRWHNDGRRIKKELSKAKESDFCYFQGFVW